MLVPIKGQPDLLKNTDTGQVWNIRDFSPWEMTAPVDRRCLADLLRPGAGETWALQHWAIVLHPWPEVIPPSLTATLEVAPDTPGLVAQEIPLFRIAEPLERKTDFLLEQRLAAVEEALGIAPEGRNRGGRLSDTLSGSRLIHQNQCVRVQINGPSDDLGPLYERTSHFLLRLAGQRRSVIY